MKCRYSENDVALYVGGDLAPAKATRIEAHLMECALCRDLAADLRESQAMFKELRQDTVSAAALSSVRARVLAEIGRQGIRPVWGRWVYALAGAVFIAVLAVGLTSYQLKSRSPLLSEGGVAAPSSQWPLPLKGADGVVGSSNRLSEVEPTTLEAARCRACASRPSAPVKVASRHSVDGRSHPSFAKEGNIPPEPPKQVVVKLFTDDPNIVIYWLVDQNGGAL